MQENEVICCWLGVAEVRLYDQLPLHGFSVYVYVHMYMNDVTQTFEVGWSVSPPPCPM